MAMVIVIAVFHDVSPGLSVETSTVSHHVSWKRRIGIPNLQFHHGLIWLIISKKVPACINFKLVDIPPSRRIREAIGEGVLKRDP